MIQPSLLILYPCMNACFCILQQINKKLMPRHNQSDQIRLSRIQLKFREISSCFILETDFRFEFLVQNMHVLRISSTYGKEKGHFD